MCGEIRNPLSNPQSLRSFLCQGRKLYYILMWTRTLTHRRKLKKRVPLYPCLSFPRHLCLVCSDACYPPSLCASALSQLWDSPWSGPSFCLFLNLCLSHISKVYLHSPLWVEISPPGCLFPCIHFPAWVFTHLLSWVPNTYEPSSKPSFCVRWFVHKHILSREGKIHSNCNHN